MELFGKELIEYNETHPEGYILFIRSGLTHNIGMPYYAMSNAGAVVEMIDYSNQHNNLFDGKNHFALLCNDTDILYIQGRASYKLYQQLFNGSGPFHLNLEKKNEYVATFNIPEGIIVAADEVNNRAKIILPLLSS